MNTIEIDRLHSLLREQLSEEERGQLEMKDLGPSGLQIRIDREDCLSNIGVWPNGCCDVEHVYVSSETGQFKHYEFQSAEEASLVVVQAVRSAIERG
jgi:hypothetical protein